MEMNLAKVLVEHACPVFCTQYLLYSILLMGPLGPWHPGVDLPVCPCLPFRVDMQLQLPVGLLCMPMLGGPAEPGRPGFCPARLEIEK